MTASHPAQPSVSGAIALYGPWPRNGCAEGCATPQPPAAWAGREVLIAVPGRYGPPALALLTALQEQLTPWRARPLALTGQAPRPSTVMAEQQAEAILAAARAGAAVIAVLPVSPWGDPVSREIIRRHLDCAGTGERPNIDCMVVDLSTSDAVLSLSDVPLDRLVAIMRRLLSEDGCPWDREQTHETLRPYLVEEAAEVLEAIERRQAHMLTDELGDLLLQIAFHAALGEAGGRFGPRDVTQAIERKMLYRHPHVFGDWQVADSSEVLRNWESLKATEAAAAGDGDGSDRGPWRPLRKAAVKVARAAFEVAAAASQAQPERLAEAVRSLEEWAAGLEAATHCTLRGPSSPPEEEQPI